MIDKTDTYQFNTMKSPMLMVDFHITAIEARDYLLANSDRSLYTVLKPHSEPCFQQFKVTLTLDVNDLVNSCCELSNLNIIVDDLGDLFLVP